MRKRILKNLLIDERNKRKHTERMLDHSEKVVLALREELRRVRGEQFERDQQAQKRYRDPDWKPFRRS